MAPIIPSAACTVGTDEHEAARADARRRITELRNVARTLWADRDDSMVMSELVTVFGEIRAAEEALR